MIHVGGHEHEITKNDVEILHEEKEGIAVQSDGLITVALNTHLTIELVNEGLAREFVSRVQNLRKEAGFDVVDRISISFSDAGPITEALQEQKTYVLNETLAKEIHPMQEPDGFVREVEINDHKVRVGIKRV